MISFLKEAATKPEILGIVVVTVCTYFALLYGIVRKLKVSPRIHKLLTFLFIIIIPGTNVFPLYYFHPFWLKNTGVMVTIAWLTYIAIGLILSSKTRHLFSHFSLICRDFSLALVLALLLLSTLWSELPWVTFINSSIFVFLSIIGAHVGAEYNLSQISSLFRWGSQVVILLSLFVGMFLPQIGIQDKGLRGVLDHPNPLGIYAVIHLLLWLINYLDPTVKNKFFSLFSIFSSLAVILLTNSASSLFQLMLLACVLFCSTILVKFSGNKSMVLLNIIFCAATFLSIFVAYNADTILTLFGRDLTLTGRTEFWPQLLQLIAEKPLLGYGFWGFWANPSGPAATVGTANFQPVHAHNGFLDAALSIGIVGLIAIILSITRSVVWGFRLLRRDRYQTVIPLLLSLFIITSNLTESRLFKVDFVWFYYAVVVTRINVAQKNPTNL
ncbi:MAG: O-antigen ligase family protein [Leptolyngbyaceae cyanobacterium]